MGITANRPTLFISDGAIPDHRIEGPTLQVDGTWHFIAGVYDGQNQLVYVDGSLAVSQAIQYTIGNANQITIGGVYGGCSTAHFAGNIDDVRIYSRPLSSNEVQQLYVLGCIPHPATATPEVVNGFVVGVNIIDGGCGYTNNTPLVLFQGGGGHGATAEAVVNNGMLEDIIITDAGIGYTNPPTILIGSAPLITSEPQSVTVNAGDNASFNVTATDFYLHYQWSLNSTNISGATNSTLTISNVTQSDLGYYAVVVTNVFGRTNSNPAALSMYPALVGPFGGAVTYWGKDATFGVEAWGTGPLSYQWFKDGVALLDATNQELTLTSIQFTNAGLYWVVVSSSFGSVTNAPAQVIVNPAGVSLGLYPGVTISGVVGYNYVIQRTADLSNTNAWATMANVTLAEPVQLWVDTNVDASLPANPHHFYQVLPGQ